MHRETVLILLASQIQFHQMTRKLITRPLCLGAVGKRAVESQRSINGDHIHWINSQGLTAVLDSQRSLLRIVRCSDARILGATPGAPGCGCVTGDHRPYRNQSPGDCLVMYYRVAIPIATR